MRIAQVAPLLESVPPRLYGGTERIVSHLTEALVEEGHDVTLFASGDSRTRARLVPACERALRLGGCRDPLALQVLQLEQVCQRAPDFDVIHFHVDPLAFPLARRLSTPSVTTLHGRLDSPELRPLYDEFRELWLVSISMAQRVPLPRARWAATIHHGLPPSMYPYVARSDDYVAFLGRVSPEKRVDRAVEIARRARVPLRIAAKIDVADRAYFEREVRHLFEDPGVEYLGEIDDTCKAEFLGRARALLFPIDWPEPFGLVMIEAMACGTPVIAFRRGSVEEVVEEGVTGFIVDDVNEAVRALQRIGELERTAVRARFEERFAVSRMAADHVSMYRSLIDRAHADLAVA